MITKEDVTLAYRLMLGREPENQDVVNSLMLNASDHQALRSILENSPEFRSRVGKILDKSPQLRHHFPFTLPHIPVEIEVSDEDLNAMFNRIHQSWESLGKDQPFWSVLTQGIYRQDQFVEHKQSFYDSGSEACSTFLATLRRNSVNFKGMEVCLEVGCGVGRVTKELSKQFPKVIAADISAPHLELANSYMMENQISNVSFLHWRDIRAIYQLPAVDIITSIVTLQHNPPPVIAWMLRNLLRALKPGGVAHIQIPTYCIGYLFEAKRYLGIPPKDNLEMHYLPQYIIFQIIREENCACLEVREDGMIDGRDNALSNTFLIQKPL